MTIRSIDLSTGVETTRELTPEEIAALPVPVDPSPLEKLAKLDIDNALTQRNLREAFMLMTEAFKQISGGAVDLSTIPGVAQVYAVEAEAEVLRAQL